MRFYDYLIEKAKEDGIEKFVVGAVVLNSDKEILILSRKKDDFMGGIDELPSGNLEKGENIYDGLAREVKEETNLDIKSIDQYINSFDYLSGSGKKTRQFNFSVSVMDDDDVMISEHDSYVWQNINECRNNPKITSEVKTALEIFNFNNK